MKLKCWTGNLDGQRNALVIASSQAKAAKVLGISTKSLRDYFGLRGDVPTGYEVETMYTQDNREFGPHHDTWTKGRCEIKSAKEFYGY